MGKKIVFSGTQPSGDLTLGNYIGAIKNWVEIQDDYECNYSIVDLHAITVPQVPKDLRANTLSVLAMYIAAGIDPDKCTIFIQSHVKEHLELSWVLSSMTYMGQLNRMTQFKEKSKRSDENLNAGLFTYPVLMASDILIYDADFVPVGDDQKQHLELARDVAERFNNRYSPTFTVPEPLIKDEGEGARIMSLQDPESKMSKSDKNENGYILLLDDDATIRRKLNRAVTDSVGVVDYNDEQVGMRNLLTIYSVLSGDSIEEIVSRYEGKGYGDFKLDLGDVVVEAISPIRERYHALMEDKDYLIDVYTKGAEIAENKARRMLNKVYRKVGFVQRKY